MSRMLWIPAAIIGTALLLLLIGAALQIDDWSRDLTNSYAATSADTPDIALRPIDSTLSPDALSAVVQTAAAEIRNWQFAGTKQTGAAFELSYVRSTKLWRFKDDITIFITPTTNGSMLNAESQSRVGRGDLGQNPRNLKELLSTVKKQLNAI